MRQRYFLIEPKYSGPDTFCHFVVGSDRVRASIHIYADLWNVAGRDRAQRRNLALRQDRPRCRRDASLSGKPRMNPRNIAASVRARLRGKARAEKLDFNLLLTRYALERMLYRLSISEQRGQFLLKGALPFDIGFDVPHLRRTTPTCWASAPLKSRIWKGCSVKSVRSPATTASCFRLTA